MVPPGIAFLSGLIKREGHEVELFDSTYYDVSYGVDSEGIKAQQLNVVPFDMGSKGIRMKTTNWKEDLLRTIDKVANLKIQFLSLVEGKDGIESENDF